MTTPIAQGPVDVNVRPLIPRGTAWVRHGHVGNEWWGMLGYTCKKRGEKWSLAYRNQPIGEYDFLSEAMLVAEGPNV